MMFLYFLVDAQDKRYYQIKREQFQMLRLQSEEWRKLI